MRLRLPGMNSLLYPIYPISMEGRPFPRLRSYLRTGGGLRSGPGDVRLAHTACEEQETEEAIEVTPWFGSVRVREFARLGCRWHSRSRCCRCCAFIEPGTRRWWRRWRWHDRHRQHVRRRGRCRRCAAANDRRRSDRRTRAATRARSALAARSQRGSHQQAPQDFAQPSRARARQADRRRRERRRRDEESRRAHPRSICVLLSGIGRHRDRRSGGSLGRSAVGSHARHRFGPAGPRTCKTWSSRCGRSRRATSKTSPFIYCSIDPTEEGLVADAASSCTRSAAGSRARRNQASSNSSSNSSATSSACK